jgi:Na+-driven multidrug efflux pump
MPAELAGQARIALFVLCASMPIMLGNNALRGVLEATQRFDLVNYVKVPSSVLFYLVAVMAIPFGVRVAGIVSLLVTIRLLSTLAYLRWLDHGHQCHWASLRICRAFHDRIASFRQLADILLHPLRARFQALDISHERCAIALPVF